jgi:hypothetical protein
MNSQSAGTPEDTKLTVKLMGSEWIVENNIGESVGSAATQEEAIHIAQSKAPLQNASIISVLGSVGNVERTIDVQS